MKNSITGLTRLTERRLTIPLTPRRVLTSIQMEAFSFREGQSLLSFSLILFRVKFNFFLPQLQAQAKFLFLGMLRAMTVGSLLLAIRWPIRSQQNQPTHSPQPLTP